IVSPTSPAFNHLGTPGAPGTVNVTAPGGCSWTATSNAAWLTNPSPASGTGNGVVTYSVASNAASHTSRTGTLTIAGQTVTVFQEGLAALISLPGNGQNPVSTTPLVAWGSVPGAVKYSLTLGTTPGAADLLS